MLSSSSLQGDVLTAIHNAAFEGKVELTDGLMKQALIANADGPQGELNVLTAAVRGASLGHHFTIIQNILDKDEAFSFPRPSLMAIIAVAVLKENNKDFFNRLMAMGLGITAVVIVASASGNREIFNELISRPGINLKNIASFLARGEGILINRDSIEELIKRGVANDSFLPGAIRSTSAYLMNKFSPQVDVTALLSTISFSPTEDERTKEKLKSCPLRFISEINHPSLREFFIGELKKLNESIDVNEWIKKTYHFNQLLRTQVQEDINHYTFNDKTFTKVMRLVEENNLTIRQALGYLNVAANSWLFQDSKWTNKGLPIEMYYHLLSFITGCENINDNTKIHKTAYFRMQQRCAHLANSLFHQDSQQSLTEEESEKEGLELASPSINKS